MTNRAAFSALDVMTPLVRAQKSLFFLKSNKCNFAFGSFKIKMYCRMSISEAIINNTVKNVEMKVTSCRSI